MKQIKPNQVVVLKLSLNSPDGNVQNFQFIDQLLPRVHDEIKWSAQAIETSIEHTCLLIDEAQRQHKATLHYRQHAIELIRFYDTCYGVNDEANLNEQDNDLRQLEMAA